MKRASPCVGAKHGRRGQLRSGPAQYVRACRLFPLPSPPLSLSLQQKFFKNSARLQEAATPPGALLRVGCHGPNNCGRLPPPACPCCARRRELFRLGRRLRSRIRRLRLHPPPTRPRTRRPAASASRDTSSSESSSSPAGRRASLRVVSLVPRNRLATLPRRLS